MSPAPSIRRTLRHPQFRALWVSGTIYFVGNAMQTMAAAWMMVELTGSSFLAALVQTAVFLPMFLFSLPAGVLADITDRRRLILAALAVQASVGALLAGLDILVDVGKAPSQPVRQQSPDRGLARTHESDQVQTRSLFQFQNHLAWPR